MEVERAVKAAKVDRKASDPDYSRAAPVSVAAAARAKAAGDGGLYKPRTSIYPKRADGRWRGIKWSLVVVLLAIYYLTPWVRWHRPEGLPQQAVLVDFAGRRFYFLFIQLWPQEV